VGEACRQLPEDHGIIFPGGYSLASGELKTFDGDASGMAFQRAVRSPNGEDVLYVFYQHREGRRILLPYNLIEKAVGIPLSCHGYSLFGDGRLVFFRAASDEPTRVHPMQIWQTPFVSDVHAAASPPEGSYLASVGNAELVRGISDLLALCRQAEGEGAEKALYEELIATAVRAADHYHWLGHPEIGNLASPLAEVREAAAAVLDEFDKVAALRARARKVAAEAEAAFEALGPDLEAGRWSSVAEPVEALRRLARQRGHAESLREDRYADLPRLDALAGRLREAFAATTEKAVDFLLGEDAFAPYHASIEELTGRAGAISVAAEAAPLGEELGRLDEGIQVLSEVISNLAVDDATVRTRLLSSISEVLGALNRARAVLSGRRGELARREGAEEFGVQLALLAQSTAAALAAADTPERCDERGAQLAVALDDLETRFGESEEFLAEITARREDLTETFAARKQALLEERRRRTRALVEAAERILDGLVRRASGVEDPDELAAFFLGDGAVTRLKEVIRRLRELSAGVEADELEGRLKTARSEAARTLRDRRDLFEEGTDLLRLGRHRFTVNTRPLALTLVARRNPDPGGGEEETLAFHLTGSSFYRPVADPRFDELRPLWDATLPSENRQVYRGEFLAWTVWQRARAAGGRALEELLAEATAGPEELLTRVREEAAGRFEEGYERGVHDEDGARILGALATLSSRAGLLRHDPGARALAALFWAGEAEKERRELWQRRATSQARLAAIFHSGEGGGQGGVGEELPGELPGDLPGELAASIGAWAVAAGLSPTPGLVARSGLYLEGELASGGRRLAVSEEAVRLRDALLAHLDTSRQRRDFEEDLRHLEAHPGEAFRLACRWLEAFLGQAGEEPRRELTPTLDEAAALLVTDRRLERAAALPRPVARVEGLLGQHPRIEGGVLRLELDEFLPRLAAFAAGHGPAFRRFQRLRHEVLREETERLGLAELTPRVMSAFVRNRLIDQVYLPLLGDNLAKQIGAVGEGKRTDQMGLLLLISPPGYGKTTLMEYVAHRLGLAFIKANGPALGVDTTSLDPTAARNATARREVEKINFAFEVGSNVLLYLDDIQHTHPELLQRFISLADSQRKVEGVWEGRPRTYDLRGKRFVLAMAGNPYTESGERFRLPDMLANRADTYNLGDILSGREEAFALSYLENALTSNPVLAPLAQREPEDVPRLVALAAGDEVSTDQLRHPWSGVELGEILAVLKKLLRVREVLLRVNAQYIASASQKDEYRTEPPFLLQGSYRNMNKIAERVVPAMDEGELEALLDDHYRGEAQTLTTGAEHNLLKLAEIRGRMSPEQRARWAEIKKSFARAQALGSADEDDPVARVTGHLALLSDRLEAIGTAIATAVRDHDQGEPAAGSPVPTALLAELLTGLGPHLEHFQERLQASFAGLAEAVRRPEPSATAAPQGDAPDLGAPNLGTYLERLGAAMEAMAHAPRGTTAQIVQTLNPGVHDLLARMTDAVAETLLPLVQQIGRRARKLEEGEDRRLRQLTDRTLKNLDQLKDLLGALRKIDTVALNRPGAEDLGEG